MVSFLYTRTAACAIAACLVTTGLLTAAPVRAQDSSADTTPHEGLQEIVVTAQKRSENIQSVPIAVTAVTGEAIENLKAVDLKGLQGTIPNLQINNFTNTPNSAVFTIRGIGVVEPDPFAGNTVSIVQDGVPQYFSMGALLDLFDVDRIEVLRGPQGTLFGANTTGGVVNVMTRQPTGEFGVRGEVTYGNWNRMDIKAAVDAPIIDGILAGKISAMHTQRDGFYTNIVDGSDMGHRNVTVLRAYLRYTPTDDIDVTLSGEYGRARNGSPVIVNGSTGPDYAIFVPAGTMTTNQVLPMYASPCASDATPCRAPSKYYSARDFGPDLSNMDNYRATLTANISNTPLGDITAITGYKSFHLEEFTDNDAVVGLGIDTFRGTRGWQFSQELRTAADLTDAIKLQAGGFYMKTHYDHFNSVRLEAFAPGLRQNLPQDQDNWSGSLFAQTYVDLTDQLRVQAGIRYTHETTEMVAGTDNYYNPDGIGRYCTHEGSCGDVLLGGFRARGKRSWDNIGWKLGIDYKVTPDTLLYASWARGFKSGGFVGRLGQASDIGPFNPEKVDTFEVGAKTDLFDRRLRLNLAGFYTNYRDMQVAQNYILPDGTTIGTSIFNAAKAEIKGFELEATALPFDGLTFTGSLAYLDAKYKTFDFLDPGGAIVDLSGRPLQNSPKWSASAGATYETAVGGGKARANVLYTYTDTKLLQGLQGQPLVHIQPTHFVNATIGWSPDDGRWTLEAWVRNLANNHYVEAVTNNPGLFNQVSYTSPREYGVTFKFDL
ncbi:TonB-dependent receptor [Novosphingobium resinovorum]|uniref:TonB-dependent receptor n=1 Tax=Novosphingobium TaxID=165696 RepID=UPI001B3C90AF|nr:MULTISPECIES: TonB-dependent receptor [Novosphingobium]MBF7014987.1 TonB-dependent receptor [Novosphingobium sp. HR1a]WJM24541.1 TonB-dependent receptor [Novosphingobium resinovorum]